MKATKILKQCLLHGDMYVCAFGVRSSSAIIQTQLCKYAFAVSVAVGRMGQSVREREHACVRTHTHTLTKGQKPIQLQNTNHLICDIQNLVMKLSACWFSLYTPCNTV